MDKKRLTQNTMTAYNILVIAKSITGFDSPRPTADNNATTFAGVFLCPYFGFALYLGELGREPNGSPLPLVRSVNLLSSPFFCLTAKKMVQYSHLTNGGNSHA